MKADFDCNEPQFQSSGINESVSSALVFENNSVRIDQLWSEKISSSHHVDISFLLSKNEAKNNQITSKESSLNKKDKKLFIELKNYLDETFTQPHSMKSLCREFGTNEFKLKQGFRLEFGTSIFAYILTCKMSYASRLLSEEKKSIQEVASIIGYKNSNHFSAAFKKNFGVVPSSLKK